MNKFFKNMMMALAGLTVAAAIWATPMTVNATRVLGSQSNGSTATQTTTETTTSETTTTDTTAAETTENTEAAELIGNGTITADSVRVRKDATTSSDVAGKAAQNTTVGVTGEKTDAEGMIWYAVTFQSEGKTINGYIRSDLMSYEAIAAPEETTSEEEAPAEDASAEETVPAGDYYVQYADDGTGVSDWYLVDQTMGKQYKVSELLSAQDSAATGSEELESKLDTFRMIIVILAVVVLILIGVVTFFIIKLRNAGDEYEYEDEDEEEDEEEEEEEDEEPVRRRGFFGRRRAEEEEDEDEEDEEEEEDEEPVRRAPARRPANTRSSRRYEEEEEEDEEEEYKPRRTQKSSKNQKDKNWQSKNFLDDDDLEFEFLDLK